MLRLSLLGALAALLASSPPQQQQFTASFDFEDEEGEAEAMADQRANEQFQTIMQHNVINIPVVTKARAVSIVAVPNSAAGAVAEIPLPRYRAVRDALEALREAEALRMAPPVVLGAASYVGEARQDSLSLRMHLRVTLGAPDHWKTVPLVGDTVVVVRAQSNGRSLPLSRQNGYHVWVTDETGEIGVDLELLVPSHSPRGSIEYDFMIAQTPVTQFRCTFPVAGLEPRLTAAVHSEITPGKGTTRLDATLRPTARVHLVGFRDLGAAEERDAKIYAESLNLLSVDEGALDLFTVIRYSILYAGTKEFLIRIPEGMEVVEADGEGAFRYLIEKDDAGTLLRGETAFPIRNSYEISLRLHREIAKSGEAFDVVRPRPVGVEREYGWLAVEVTGKLKLEQQAAEAMRAVDIRQLPTDMLDSAVSPILRAYRYHSPDARLRLVVEKLPEREPASASIDRLRATSVVTDDGKVLTQIRITLRNRLRHHLILTLPPETEVRSSLLDGQPIKPSRDAAGRLMLPLKRSAGVDRLRPFTAEVVLEGQISSLGWIGFPDLALPAVDLPTSSVVWNIYLPAKNVYRRPHGDIEAQFFWGTGQWHQPVMQAHPAPAAPVALIGGGVGGAPAAADSGAMPVRIQVPKSGHRLQYTRYWLDAGQPVTVSLAFVRSWLLDPLRLALAVLFGLGLWLVADALLPASRGLASWRVGAGLTIVLAWPLWKVGGVFGVGGAVLVALVGLVFTPGRWAALSAGVSARVQRGRDEYQAYRDTTDRPRTGAGLVLWRLMMGGVLGISAIVLFGLVVRLLWLLGNPLG